MRFKFQKYFVKEDSRGGCNIIQTETNLVLGKFANRKLVSWNKKLLITFNVMMIQI